MRRILIIFSLSILIYSCSRLNENSNSEIENITSKVENKRIINDKLLAFKTVYIAELGEKKYFELEKEIDKGKIEIEYINDIIYISYYKELNACGEYDGNIEFINDTINLQIDLISDEVCTSTVIDKVTFLIDNPGRKKKFIIK
jgi:hypothetical protein